MTIKYPGAFRAGSADFYDSWGYVDLNHSGDRVWLDDYVKGFEHADARNKLAIERAQIAKPGTVNEGRARIFHRLWGNDSWFVILVILRNYPRRNDA